MYFELAMLYTILDLWSGTGQTDGQTDTQTTAINALCPTL